MFDFGKKGESSMGEIIRMNLDNQFANDCAYSEGGCADEGPVEYSHYGKGI